MYSIFTTNSVQIDMVKKEMEFLIIQTCIANFHVIIINLS